MGAHFSFDETGAKSVWRHPTTLHPLLLALISSLHRVHLFIHSFTHSLIHSFGAHSHTHTCIHSFLLANCIAFHCITFHYIAFHYIAHCITFHFIALHYFMTGHDPNTPPSTKTSCLLRRTVVGTPNTWAGARGRPAPGPQSHHIARTHCSDNGRPATAPECPNTLFGQQAARTQRGKGGTHYIVALESSCHTVARMHVRATEQTSLTWASANEGSSHQGPNTAAAREWKFRRRGGQRRRLSA